MQTMSYTVEFKKCKVQKLLKNFAYTPFTLSLVIHKQSQPGFTKPKLAHAHTTPFIPTSPTKIVHNYIHKHVLFSNLNTCD